MKPVLRFFLLLCAFALALNFHACEKPCEGECVNGECNEGDCTCDVGYYGSNCITSIAEDFPGTYSGTINYLAADTSWSATTTDFEISLAANLYFSAGPVTPGADFLVASNGSSALLVDVQAVSSGEFSGSIVPVLSPPSGTFQLKLTGTWETATRSTAVNALLSRPL